MPKNQHLRDLIAKELPATVARFQLVSDSIPILHAGGLTAEINGRFVGVVSGQPFWDEMPSADLEVALASFIDQTLDYLEAGLGWLHLEFSDGWLRVLADTWEPWVINLPSFTWVGASEDSPLGRQPCPRRVQ